MAAALIVAWQAQGAHAQSSVQLYGLVDAWLGSSKTLGSGQAWTVGGGGMSTSYWGLRGTDDLGGGWHAKFVLEDFFRPQNGRAGSFDGEPFFGRSAEVSIGGPYGSVHLGRIVTPYFVTAVLSNPFIDSYTFSPTVLQTYLGVNGQGLIGGYAWNNAVLYRTPVLSGFSADAIYALGNQPGNAHKWGGSAGYAGGIFSISVAFQSQPFDTTPGDLDAIAPGYSKQTAVMVGALCDLNVVRFYGQYQHLSNDISGADTTVNGVQLGVAVPIGDAKALASYMYSKSSGASQASRSTLAVGFDYNVSRRTDLYAAVLADRASTLSSGLTYGVGIRSRF
ncbi:outer membrane porin [Caballeronia pedi]|uniref:Outer membrane porin n=1 Tax=Caballeronia pedi TaxID=1777141 RepID=A0A158BNR1_9BURK|nr:porin [Caballeronia pedi]SAK71661.1 outer membrane porin [Caballeronia pedi]